MLSRAALDAFPLNRLYCSTILAACQVMQRIKQGEPSYLNLSESLGYWAFELSKLECSVGLLTSYRILGNFVWTLDRIVVRL